MNISIPAILARSEEILLALLLAALILLAAVQIGLRLFFDSGLVWLDPLLRQLVVWAGFLGALLGVKRGRHIALDLSGFLFAESVLRQLRRLTSLCACLVCALLTYASLRFLSEEIAFSTGRLLGLPSWAWNLIFPITFSGMTIRYLYRTVFAERPAAAGVGSGFEAKR